MTTTTFKCPFCEKKYVQKPSLYTHMDKEHKEQLNGLQPAQVYFNFKNKKDGGKCIMCGKPTPFNFTTEKYERICSKKCKDAYARQFKERMMKKYGKTTLLNSPEVQKKMLANRKISGTYEWSEQPEYKFAYTGSYELDFLQFLDVFMNWNPNDLHAPCPFVIEYMYKGKKHFYIPDFYIPSLNLVIEVKSFENKHYRERDVQQEKAKDLAVKKGKYNYFKVHDKYYDDFFEYLTKLKAV